MAMTTHTAHGQERAPRIRLGQARLFFSALPFSITTIQLMALLLAVIQWSVVDHGAILLWLGISFTVTLLRWWQYRAFKAAEPDPGDAGRWERQALISGILSGTTWLTADLLMFPPDSLPHQIVLSFMVAGVAAGSVTTLTPILPAVSAFLVMALTPLSIRFFLITSPFSLLLGAMLLVLLVLMIQAASRLYRMIEETLAMHHEKCLAEAAVKHQAHYDELTDLPNRRLLFQHLDQELARARRHGHLNALLFFDLDNFKNINDTLGHDVGDKLLQQVAKRITSHLRTEDILARLGGDEFVVLLPEIGRTPEAAAQNCRGYVKKIRGLFASPFMVEGHRLNMTTSIGVVLFPTGDQNRRELLKQADVAMYRAKARGPGSYQFFEPAMQAALQRRLELERGLRMALRTDQLELYYQPQVDHLGRIHGAEALVRWHHPERGLIPPSEFVPVAEESGLILSMGQWVLHTACEHLRELERQGRHITLSVNISPRQFAEADFVGRVEQVLEETGVDPRRLHLEVTEGMVLDNVEQTIAHMEALRKMGIRFAVDDFGTGHSSLAYLKKLPISTLKIDRSFVIDITTDPNDAVLVETIIDMADHLGLATIAEGVETLEARNFLHARGCRDYQGYLYSPPVPFEALLLLPEVLAPNNLTRLQAV